MTETWLTYRELAQALDISAEAARQKAIRGGWARQRGNDGKARILVDPEAEKAAHTPRRRPDKRLHEHPDERRTFDALEAHIATLKEAVVKAEAVGERHRQEAKAASTAVSMASCILASVVTPFPACNECMHSTSSTLRFFRS